MSSNKVSIIIPVYNRQELINHTLDSVRKQTYKNLECIIIDDGSTDNIADVVEVFCNKDSRINFISRSNSQIKGANTCRNIGLSLAKGEYIKWLDSDDILAPDCLEKQLRQLQATGADVCYCQTGYFNEINGQINYLDKLWSNSLRADDLTYALVMGKLRWPILSGLWRKEVLPQKPFKEGLMNSQEWLFHIEMSLNKKIKYTFTDEVLCHARVHEGSMSNRAHKKGTYNYHAAWARALAIQALAQRKPVAYKSMVAYLFKKYVWFHLFSLYKGGINEFILLFRFYPRMLVSLWN
jgi:glycosyltransferase involved in cell wall biosynthesis